MKKNVFISTILLFVFGLNIQIKAKNYSEEKNDSIFYENAKKVEKLSMCRPNSAKFLVNEAWEILQGKKPCSEEYSFSDIKYKNFYLLKRVDKGKEKYILSEYKNEWLPRLTYYKVGKWRINWNSILTLFFCILIFLNANFNLKNKIINWRQEFIDYRKRPGNSFDTEENFIFEKIYKIILPLYLILIIIDIILGLINNGSFTEFVYIFIIGLLFTLYLIQMRSLKILRKLNR